jgi:phosphate transport system permease protein
VTERTTARDRAGGPEPEDPAQVPAMTNPPAAAPPPPSERSQGRAERVFRGLSSGAGLVVVVSIALVGLFLLIQAVPSLLANQENFLTYPGFDATNLRFGIRDLLIVTVMSSVLALVLAMPVALGIALFLTQYAPSRFARPFAYVVDLLAAVPSIVFGLWGFLVLAPFLQPFLQFLENSLGWFFLFSPGNIPTLTGTIFMAGVVLAVMILPIVTAVSREVFSQTPRIHMEAAQALGATRWEVVRMAVLPYGRSGYIAGSMLGLGRALGETIAVLIILRPPGAGTAGGSLFDGGQTFASLIAGAAAEFSQPLPTGAYIAAGLVLFILTFVVNALARVIAGGKVNG